MTTGTKSVKAVKAPAAPAAAPADSKESLLLRKAADSYAFPALESVANQFARSLRDLIRALGAPAIQVERAGAEALQTDREATPDASRGEPHPISRISPRVSVS